MYIDIHSQNITYAIKDIRKNAHWYEASEITIGL